MSLLDCIFSLFTQQEAIYRTFHDQQLPTAKINNFMATIPQRIQDYLMQLHEMQRDPSKTKDEIEQFQRRFIEQETKLAQHAIALKRNEQEQRKKEYWAKIKELEIEERIEQKKQKEKLKDQQIQQINALRMKLQKVKERPDLRKVLEGIEDLILEVQKMM